MFNEFIRREISIAYRQVEVRQRTDSPVKPISGEGLPTRVEKKRKNKKRIDLESSDFAEIFAIKRKSKKAAKNPEEKAAKSTEQTHKTK